MIDANGELGTESRRLAALEKADIIPRIWARDHTVWGPDPKEIADRLGWLRAPESMRAHVPALRAFADAVRSEGSDTVALLGMGGSSLAPETLAALCRSGDAPRLVVLDTTHPSAVRRALDRLKPARTLYIVSTKSGTTTETLTLFRTFYRHVTAALGNDAGARFVAITDPGSPLVDLAREHGFRRVFLNDPDFGGRYAALSLVGLVPAALLGLDLDQLLDDAQAMAARCGAAVPIERHPAARLAALLATHADEGRDKVTFLLPPRLASFGDWLEQLIAESTGKHGKGLLPVVGESLGSREVYGGDRVFVRLGCPGETPEPTLAVDFDGPEALGGQFFLWEMTTALLGHFLGVNPFNQPDVESAKEAARRLLSTHRTGSAGPAAVASPFSPDVVSALAEQATPGDYIALLAYLDPTAKTSTRLGELRRTLRDATRCATTVGFGPRYLHSTGQLHKGDAGRGLFLVLIDDPKVDVEIPDGQERPLGFRLLAQAQAAGDAQALAARGRRVAVLRIDDDASLTM